VKDRGPRDDLYESAERFARSGLRAFLDDDPPIFLLHAGTALEHLTKAYLASQNPSLIAAPDFDSLLHVCGLGSHARRSPLLMKTISVTESLKRSGQLIPTLQNLSNDLGLLVDVRNGVAHAGQVQAGAASSVVVPFLKACDELLTALGISRGQFWGDLTEVVDARLSESAEAADIRAAEAVATARAEFETRYATLDPDMRRTVVGVIESGYHLEGHEQDLAHCPSCGSLALVSGTIDVDWDVDWEKDDFGQPFVIGATPTVTLFPNHLECRACGLNLDGLDELVAAGLERSWRMEDVDADVLRAEYQQEWEGFEP
jgi:hypothetical protein